MKGQRIPHTVFVLLLSVLTLFISMSTASAWAVTTAKAATSFRGHSQSALQAPMNVTYHGGPVTAGTMKVYAIFWEPTGSVVDPAYNTLLKQYYQDVGGTGLYNIMNQYTQQAGGAPTTAMLAGSYVDTATVYPGNTLSQAQITAEVTHAMTMNKWTAAPSHYFPVYSAKGIGTTEHACAYHASTSSSGILYAHIVYPTSGCAVPTSPNGCSVCDSAISTSAHEQFEAATNPLDPPLKEAWYYTSDSAGEIADLCEPPWYSQDQYGPLLYDTGQANQMWNGHFYIIQEMWDNTLNGLNQTGGCSQGQGHTIKITEFPTPSGGDPFGITTGPDGNLWFTEATVSQIGKITPGGAFTEYSAHLGGPEGITAGPDGNLWFAAQNGSSIGRITPKGVVTAYPLPINGSEPWDITAGPDGNLWFTESISTTGKIGKITPGGTLTEYPIPTYDSGPVGITAGPDGNLWFTEFGGNKIGQIAPNGAMTEYPIPTSNSQPQGITAGPDGNVWFTEGFVGKIGRVTLN